MVLTSDFKDVPVPKVPLYKYFGDVWAKHGDRIAVVEHDTQKRVTYTQLVDRIKLFAAALQSVGVENQMRVQYFLKDSIDSMAVMKAMMFMNASMVLCRPHTQLTTREYVYQVRDSEVKFIICDESTIEIVSNTFREFPDIHHIKVIFCGPKKGVEDYLRGLNLLFMHEIIINCPEWIPPPVVNDTDSALISYTSGTTGKPKGANHPVKTMIGQVEMITKGSKDVFTRDEVYLLSTSLFYSFEVLYSEVIFQLGGTVVMSRIEMRTCFPEICERNKITLAVLLEVTVKDILATIPQFPNYKEQIKSMRILMFCGSVMRPQLAEKLKDFFGPILFTNNYGMTENFAISFSTPGRDCVCHVGRPLPNQLLKVVDRETREEVEDGCHGEIMLKSQTLMTGYLNQTEEQRVIDDDGWISTGDLGFISKDRYIHLVDRCKQIIICMDDTLSPGELEEILKEDDAVFQAVCVGIPSEEYGEAPTAFVVLKEGEKPSKETAERLMDTIKRLTSVYKHLYGGVYFCSWDVIPKTGNGKVSRLNLRDKFLKGEIECVKPQ